MELPRVWILLPTQEYAPGKLELVPTNQGFRKEGFSKLGNLLSRLPTAHRPE